MNAVAGFDHKTRSEVYRELSERYRAFQPGWFPFAPFPLAVWLSDPPIIFVKLLRLALVALTFGTFALVARRLFQSSEVAVAAAVVALGAWQLRMPHDPVVGTSFVTPWLVELVLFSYVAWYSYRVSRNVAWLLLACLSVAVAMLTDPAAWGFATLLAVLGLVDATHRRLSLAIVATIFAAASFSFVIGTPQLPWHRMGSYADAVFSQMLAPMPASYRGFGHLSVGRIASFWHGPAYVDDRFINVPAVDFWGWLRSVACAVAIFISLSAAPPKPKRRPLGEPLIFGLGFWIIPAIMLGPPEVWHGGVPLGQSFDVVYFQYFGVAVLATAAIMRVREISVTASLLAPSLCALGIFLLCYGNARADATTIARTARLESSRDLIERAGAAGFFDVLPAGTTIAVSPSEPFANGIHSRISDAKYAIFHYSKRRFAVIGTDELGRRPGVGTWILGTSRTSPLQVTLEHWAGNEGKYSLTDHAYGYSVLSDVAATFEDRRRGVDVNLRTLVDGTSVEARRKCGPVALRMAFESQRPNLSWGPGFYQRGPFGYSYPNETHDPMFMGTEASLVLRPTTCEPVPLVLNAVIAAGGTGILYARFRNRTEHFLVSEVPRQLSIRIERVRQPVEVIFRTSAPAADLDPVFFRYQRDRPRDLRIRFDSPVVAEQTPEAMQVLRHVMRP